MSQVSRSSGASQADRADQTSWTGGSTGPSEAASRSSDNVALAAVDIGTVSTRLILALVGPSGEVRPVERQAVITNLGTGVDATGRLDPAAIERTCETVRSYGARLAGLAMGDGTGSPCAAQRVAVTLTSAARDASNAGELLGRLAALGLEPQVIGGDVEARLSLLGVTSDFADRVLVADIGGGSTELVSGGRAGGSGEFEVGSATSFDVGCRRVTERFFGEAGVPAPDAVQAARDFVRGTLGAYFAGDAETPRTLACVGGTATSLVSVANRLVPYDSAFVHLHRTSRDEVSALARELLAMGPSARRALPGLQPKRADVIGAGALILDELMALGGHDEYVASESDSLFGLLACMRAVTDGTALPFGWAPMTSDAASFMERCSR